MFKSEKYIYQIIFVHDAHDSTAIGRAPVVFVLIFEIDLELSNL